jgi:hypothetical protein
MQGVGTIKWGAAEWISNCYLSQNIHYLLYSGCASSLYTSEEYVRNWCYTQQVGLFPSLAPSTDPSSLTLLLHPACVQITVAYSTFMPMDFTMRFLEEQLDWYGNVIWIFTPINPPCPIHCISLTWKFPLMKFQSMHNFCDKQCCYKGSFKVDLDFISFTKRIYKPESPDSYSFSRYSPFTLIHFFHCPGKLLMPAA